MIAATSVGIVDGKTFSLTSSAKEDYAPPLDMNVVMLYDRGLVGNPATAEQNSYSRTQLNQMLDYAEKASESSSPSNEMPLDSAT